MSVHFPNPIPAALADRARRMSGTLRCDFADGHVGERLNGFGHRTRSLRQPATPGARVARPVIVSVMPA
jgi:hypothetical protein